MQFTWVLLSVVLNGVIIVNSVTIDKEKVIQVKEEIDDKFLPAENWERHSSYLPQGQWSSHERALYYNTWLPFQQLSGTNKDIPSTILRPPLDDSFEFYRAGTSKVQPTTKTQLPVTSQQSLGTQPSLPAKTILPPWSQLPVLKASHPTLYPIHDNFNSAPLPPFSWLQRHNEYFVKTALARARGQRCLDPYLLDLMADKFRVYGLGAQGFYGSTGLPTVKPPGVFQAVEKRVFQE